MNIAKLPNPHPGNDPAAEHPVTSHPSDRELPYHFPSHKHDRAQLVYASRGVMTVTTTEGTWVVPPQQAVWVPAGITHEVIARGALSMRSLYFHSTLCKDLSKSCCVIAVNSFFRELILEIMRFSEDDLNKDKGARLVSVLIDQLYDSKPVPLHLPYPHDQRLQTITQALLETPSNTLTLKYWSKNIGASERTLARLFIHETGMNFSEWRTRLRVLLAIERLALGYSVTEIGYDLGYSSPSAFIAMFRKTVGVSPSQYLL